MENCALGLKTPYGLLYARSQLSQSHVQNFFKIRFCGYPTRLSKKSGDFVGSQLPSLNTSHQDFVGPSPSSVRLIKNLRDWWIGIVETSVEVIKGPSIKYVTLQGGRGSEKV